MGDLPLYVGDDSADVYEYRKCFQLDDKFYPKFVSGASPDYFSKDGQLWGHPLYDWNYLKKTRYNFWIKRLKWNNEIFDIFSAEEIKKSALKFSPVEFVQFLQTALVNELERAAVLVADVNLKEKEEPVYAPAPTEFNAFSQNA